MDSFLRHPVLLLPELKKSFLSDASHSRGHGQEEGRGSHRGVYGDQGRPVPGCGGLAAQEDQEAEDPHQELDDEEPHGEEPQPGVDAVEVGDGVRVALLVCPEGVVVPGGQEPQHHAGDGQDVEEGVQELGVDTTTTMT